MVGMVLKSVFRHHVVDHLAIFVLRLSLQLEALGVEPATGEHAQFLAILGSVGQDFD